jgi:hypothetical protein
VKAVARVVEPADEHVDVMPRPAGHLIAGQLRFLDEAGLTHRPAELPQLMSDEVTLSRTIPREPIRGHKHAP